VPRHVARLVVDYFAYTACPGASAPRAARHAARRQLLRLRRASGCLGTSRSDARLVSPLAVNYFDYTTRPGALARHAARHAARCRLLHVARLVVNYFTSRSSSSTTSPRVGSSSTTSPRPRVRVPRHVARLVTRLVIDNFAYSARLGALTCRAARCRLLHVGQLVVDYFASRRLIVDYFAYASHSGALARRATRLAARRRLLLLRCTSGCLGTSRGSSRSSSSTTSPTPRVRVPRHVARLVTRLVVDYFTSRGSLSTTSPRAGSLSTTSPTPPVRVPQHVAWLVLPLAVDYFGYATLPGALARRAARHAARR
jgi:hypothetical protein